MGTDFGSGHRKSVGMVDVGEAVDRVCLNQVRFRQLSRGRSIPFGGTGVVVDASDLVLVGEREPMMYGVVLPEVA